VRHDAPAELREGMEDNLRTLVVEQLAAINLRLMTKAAPDDRFLGPRCRALLPAPRRTLIMGSRIEVRLYLDLPRPGVSDRKWVGMQLSSPDT
jgi:hypothetical protein